MAGQLRTFVEAMKELWIDIPGFEHYQLSNFGRLRSVGARLEKSKGKELKLYARAGKSYRRYLMAVLRCKATKKSFSFYVHRLLWELFVGPIPDGYQIDHKDGNSLNNSLDNLRLATPSQNSINRKGYSKKIKGVYFRRRNSGRPSWQAKIGVDGKMITVGTFDTEEEAARAYNDAARKYYGEFAQLNAVDG